MCDKDNAKNLITINSICCVIKFSGEAALDFLNNLLISDLLILDKNTYHYTALCNPKGRIISSIWIKIHPEGQVAIVCPSSMKNDLLSFFTMRKFRLKLDILLSDEKVFIHNNLSITTLSNFMGVDTQDELGYFYQFMFSQNLPWINKNNSEKFIPQHVNLNQHKNIMSFTKGCYPGQEIIARLKYLGKIKKHMCVISDTTKEALLAQIDLSQQVSPIVYDLEKKLYQLQIVKTIKYKDT